MTDLMIKIIGFVHGSVVIPMSFYIGVFIASKLSSIRHGRYTWLFNGVPLLICLAVLAVSFLVPICFMRAMVGDHFARVYYGKLLSKWSFVGLLSFLIAMVVRNRFFVVK